MKSNVTKTVKTALTTGFAVAALSLGATAFAAPAQASGDGFECSTDTTGVTGTVNCNDGASGALLRGNFAAKYKCAGSSRWFVSQYHVADGSHPINVECAPHSGVTGLHVLPDPVPV